MSLLLGRAVAAPLFLLCLLFLLGTCDVAALETETVFPIRPLVSCHTRLNATHCLSVFGYENRNTQNYVIEVAPRRNAVRPRPFDRGQPTVFLSRHRDDDAFRVLWHCGGYRANKQPPTWTLAIEMANGQVLRHRATVVKSADTEECSPEMMINFLKKCWHFFSVG